MFECCKKHLGPVLRSKFTAFVTVFDYFVGVSGLNLNFLMLCYSGILFFFCCDR